MLWLMFVIVWTAVAVAAGLAMGATVRKAQQMEAPDPYVGLLAHDQREAVAP